MISHKVFCHPYFFFHFLQIATCRKCSLVCSFDQSQHVNLGSMCTIGIPRFEALPMLFRRASKWNSDAVRSVEK
jgi:hypothetical protein